MAKDLESRITNTPKKPPSLADNIRAMEQQFSMAMPKGMEAQQLVRDALTCLRQNPGLMTCTQESVLGGLMTCSQLGLRPGVLGHAWLIPFTNRAAGTREATLVIGYQGLIDLAYRSGKVQSLVARTVYENDVFDVDYGLNDKLVHKPIINGEKGEPVAYYAIVKYTGGGHAFYVMSHTEMLRYRRMYAKSPDRGPWNEHFEKMAWKTVIRQLSRFMPKSTELQQAVAADNTVRVDTTPSAIDYPEYAEPAEDDEPIDVQEEPAGDD